MSHPADNGEILKDVDEIRGFEYDRGFHSRDLEVAALKEAYAKLKAEYEAYVASHPDTTPPPDPEPEPEPEDFSRRFYVCQQVSSTNELNGYGNQFKDAERTVPSINGLSIRFPWKAYDAYPTMLQAGLDQAKQNKWSYYAIRSMAGKHTPATKMGPTLTEGGVTYPSPFEGSKGAPNKVFIDNLEAHNRVLAKFLVDNCPPDQILQWTWYAKEWAEIYHGPAVRSAAGYSVDKFIATHNAIIDAAARVQKDFPTLIMGLQLSGHGPIGTVRSESQEKNVVLVEELVKHADAVIPPGRAIIHANGWSNTGQWGQASAAVDETMDAAFDAAESGQFFVGMQAIQPWGGTTSYPQYTSSQVNAAFKQAEDVGTDSIEIYTPSVLSTNGGAVWAQPTAAWID